MAVRGDLRRGQRDLFFPCGLSNDIALSGGAIPHMHWNAAAQIGQVKGIHSVTAVGCADQLKQRLIICNGKLRPIAECPAYGSKVASEHAYFTDVWCSHSAFSYLQLHPVASPGSGPQTLLHNQIKAGGR